MNNNTPLDLELRDKKTRPVQCLGLEFESDEVRRAYFTEELRKKLQNPEFREIEGFPKGTDEDILKLSDPPYYTACPNPWIADFIAEWKTQKPDEPEDYRYHREPFAADVSEGKGDPIYNAHSYHTKVPYKAIMRYILHYTQPGDIVFDGFCGTGMTGVAAQMCGDREAILSLGYQVEPDGVILQQEIDEDDKKIWRPISKLGARKAILNDLSPAATFIASNYTTPIDVLSFAGDAKKLIEELEDKTKTMWETLHSDGKTVGKINYTVWSDVYSCPKCSLEINYYKEAFRKVGNTVEQNREFKCPHCDCLISKNPQKTSTAEKPDRIFESSYDPISTKISKKQKQIPVLINYSIGTKRYEKLIDDDDLSKATSLEIYGNLSKHIPVAEIIKGDKSADPFGCEVRYVHQFYTKRILASLSILAELTENHPQLEFLIGSMLPKLTILNRYMPQHGGRAVVGPMANTLYVPPVSTETNVIDKTISKSKKILQALTKVSQALTPLSGSMISTQAAQSVVIEEASIDYIFLDPPFGSNIMYSELNYIREAWLRVSTNNRPEAIENKTQKKGINEYRNLMTNCFEQAFKCLKPGRWMTVEFSNTKASVWNSIQNALSDAGFIVASVAALDKTRGGLHAMIGPTAVKQDLIISAYKPNGGFEERFQKEAQTEEGVWDFVRTHLEYLPIIKHQGGALQLIQERDPRILFDQMVAYYVRKGFPVPISSQEFQIGLQQFSERDGMYFLPDQVVKYDRERITLGRLTQISLFVSDEESAIQWLKQQLIRKPQTFQDLHPKFLTEIGGWSKNEKPLELSSLLEQNFLRFNGRDKVPSQIHSYLSTNWSEFRNLQKDDPRLLAKAKNRWYVPDPNKAGDLEKLREKALLREFEDYKGVKKNIKVFRIEAVRAGFKKAWQDRNYGVIIDIARKIPINKLEEDPKLLMWYDQAVTKSEQNSK